MGCVTDLEERMKKADYEHDWSDSHRVAMNGVEERAKIVIDLSKLPRNIAHDLIDKYVPKEHQRIYKSMLGDEL